MHFYFKSKQPFDAVTENLIVSNQQLEGNESRNGSLEQRNNKAELFGEVELENNL